MHDEIFTGLRDHIDQLLIVEDEIISRHTEFINDVLDDPETSPQDHRSTNQVLQDLLTDLRTYRTDLEAVTTALEDNDLTNSTEDKEALHAVLQAIVFKRAAENALAEAIENRSEEKRAGTKPLKHAQAILSATTKKSLVRRSVGRFLDNDFPRGALPSLDDQTLREAIVSNVDNKEQGKSVLLTSIMRAKKELDKAMTA